MSKPGDCIRCGKPVGEHEALCPRCKANINQSAGSDDRKFGGCGSIGCGLLLIATSGVAYGIIYLAGAEKTNWVIVSYVLFGLGLPMVLEGLLRVLWKRWVG